MKLGKCIWILFLLPYVLSCSSEDNVEIVNIEGTKWISIENGTTGDANDIASGKQEGTYFRVALSGIEVFQTKNKYSYHKYSGIYRFDYPYFIIEMDNGTIAKYKIEKDCMNLVGVDDTYFPKKMYLCVEGESTYKEPIVDIFTGKTWYMAYIAIEGQYKMYDFWQGDQNARIKSFETIRGDNYTLTFDGAELDSSNTGGAFTGRATSAKVSGNWNANGENRNLRIEMKRAESDNEQYLGKAFVEGLKKAYRYDGDNKNLYIYYKEGVNTMYIYFAPQRNSGY